MTRDRKTYIGGPDAAMIVGRSPFGGAFDVWQRKMGLTEDFESTLVMDVGTALEAVVCNEYTKRTGYQLQTADTIFNNIDTWRGGSVDRLIYNDTDIVGVLEAKTASSWKRSEYGEEGTDEVPEHYLIQCAWYMALTDLPWCDLAVLFIPHTFCVFHIDRNEALEKALISRCRKFWFDHVVAQTPPEYDGSKGADDYLSRIFPSNKLDMLEAGEEVEAIMASLSKENGAIKTAEIGRRLKEQQLKAIIGDHDGVQCRTGRALWKADTNGNRRFRFTHYIEN